jgi:hypothetical protein
MCSAAYFLSILYRALKATEDQHLYIVSIVIIGDLRHVCAGRIIGAVLQHIHECPHRESSNGQSESRSKYRFVQHLHSYHFYTLH